MANTDSVEAALKTAGKAMKKFLISQITGWAAAETAKAWIAGWGMAIPTFGGSLVAAGINTAAIVGLASAGVMAVNAVKFADGGVIDSGSTLGDKTSTPMANFNGNELVSNPKQQANLLHAISNNRNASIPGNSGGGGSADLKVILNVDGVKLADGVVKNYNRARQLNLITTLKD